MPRHRTFLIGACVLAIGALLPGRASAALPPGALPIPGGGTFLYMNSQPGDPIGGQIESLYTAADSAISASVSLDRRSFSAFVNQDNFRHWWHVELAAPVGQALGPGPYEGAFRWPFQPPESPGLSIFGDGRGCNTLTGRFDVTTVSFAPTGELIVFEADFEQHCEGGSAALFGRIRIENPPPPPDLTPPTLVLPTDITTESPTGAPIAIGYSAFAQDDRDPAPSTTCDPASGALFSVGETTVNCTATDASGNAATGRFRITVLPPLQFGLALDDVASVNLKTGVATVSGTLSCSRPFSVWVSGELTQLFARRVLISGTYGMAVECKAPTTRWRVEVIGANGRFGAGSARLRTDASGCEHSCHSVAVVQDIRLLGKR